MKSRAPRQMGRVDVLITGGGTAGHVLPAISIAHALVAIGYQPERIEFVGARNGMEERLVPAAGYSVTLLPGRGIVRRFALSNLSAGLGLIVALIRAIRLVLSHNPAVVVSVGGYAGVPSALAGGLLGIPVVAVNVDAVPGAANRLIGRFAMKCAVAYAGTPLPRAIVTGAPVRPEVLAVDRSMAGRRRAREQFRVANEQTLLVVIGGSLGARRLNDAAIGLAQHFATRSDLSLYHVSGARDHESVVAKRAALGLDGTGLDYRVVAFEDHLPDLLAAADLVISRAGASTIAELTTIGVPSILVPLPDAPGDHQRRNAEVLAQAGAALIVEDADATGDSLARRLGPLLLDHARLSEMATAAEALGHRDAADRVAHLVDETAQRSGFVRRIGRIAQFPTRMLGPSSWRRR